MATAVAIALLGSTKCQATDTAEAPIIPYKVLAEHPHDSLAYTEGLVFVAGEFYESTGLLGQSTIRKVDANSGAVQQKLSLPGNVFGEGLAFCGGKFFQLSWTSQIAFVYDAQLHPLSQFNYAGEGWGLSCEDGQLLMSNGSATLQYMDTETHKILRTLTVSDHGQPVQNLNELEYVNGRIFANIWQTDLIAIIDPKSGRVTGWMDLSLLRQRFPLPKNWDSRENVPNGIAYDPASGHLFLTGKRWPKIFEIAIDGALP